MYDKTGRISFLWMKDIIFYDMVDHWLYSVFCFQGYLNSEDVTGMKAYFGIDCSFCLYCGILLNILRSQLPHGALGYR